MSTEFYVDLNDFNEWDRNNFPLELVATASDGRLQIGKCFANGDRNDNLINLLSKEYGVWPPKTLPEHANSLVSELRLSEKPYFSKWGENSQIEFFDTKLRFCWYIPMALQKPVEETEDSEGESLGSSEDYQKTMLDFWNVLLKDRTPIYHGSTHQIEAWEDLREAIFGENRYMEPSRFIQGSVRVL